MRTHGKITRWNDERGFGFIRPAGAEADLFVHISAFPRDGVRPGVDELISFDVEAGPDGRQRAVRVMRAGQHTVRRPPATRQRRAPGRSRLARSLALAAFVGLGLVAWSAYQARVRPMDASDWAAPLEQAAPDSRYSCDGRTMCSQMGSCAEAKYFIRNCPGTQMDGDDDGVPCESQWCG
jgi:cold shock CspA family protein